VALNQEAYIRFSLQKGRRIMNLIVFFNQTVVSSVKKVAFDSSRMFYIILRCC
jgi:hypothetical protein